MSTYVCRACDKQIHGLLYDFRDSNIIINYYGYPIGVAIGEDKVDYYIHISCLKPEVEDESDRSELAYKTTANRAS